MVFSSSIFLFWFLPAFLGAYYATPPKWRSYTITIGSYIFYGWWRIDMLALLIGVTIWAWGCSKMIERSAEESRRKFWMGIGVCVALLTLGYYKYANLFLDSLNGLFGIAGREPIDFEYIILPIGISFFTFQAISYVIDVYRRDAKATSLITLAAYSALFPQLIAGPVLRYKDLDDQFRSRTHTLEKFGEGTLRFAQGFAMKVVIADTVAPLVDASFGLDSPQLLDAWLGALAYSIQIYFDFAGYSSMAIGLGLMMGFRFIENFDQPYSSLSITEFWRRWHISLSTWLRDYLYIPLGGNRKGTWKTYRNLFLTMVLGGFWHGANWTFLLWGAWHGSILSVERWLGGKEKRSELVRSPIGAWFLTSLFVLIGWVMFRATSVSSAFAMYAGMLGLNGAGLSSTLVWQVSGLQMTAFAAAIILIFIGAMRARALAPTVRIETRRTAALATTAWAAILCIAVTKLVADSYSPFLYFQF